MIVPQQPRQALILEHMRARGRFATVAQLAGAL